MAITPQHGSNPTDPLQFLDGGGESGALMRSLDWSGTPLGDPRAGPGH